MLKRMTKIYLTSVEILPANKVLGKSVMINFRQNPTDTSKTSFAEVQLGVQCYKIEKFSELIKKLEGSLIKNKPINLIVRTNEKHMENFDQVVKIEFLPC